MYTWNEIIQWINLVEKTTRKIHLCFWVKFTEIELASGIEMDVAFRRKVDFLSIPIFVSLKIFFINIEQNMCQGLISYDNSALCFHFMISVHLGLQLPR